VADKKSKVVEIKTKTMSESAEDFINAVPEEQKRKDSFVIIEMMKKASEEEPKQCSYSLIIQLYSYNLSALGKLK